MEEQQPPPLVPSNAIESSIINDVDDELRRVVLALDAVFRPGQNDSTAGVEIRRQASEADRYLVDFQRRAESWMVCDRLLSAEFPTAAEQQGGGSRSTPADMRARFFAAQTLHYKCRLDMRQLPVQAVPRLRDTLVNHLMRHASSANAVALVGRAALVTRLAMAVAALAVQMQWNSIIEQVTNTFLPQSDDPSLRHAWAQIIQLLPEECNSDRLLPLDQNTIPSFQETLCRSSSSIISFLEGLVAAGTAGTAPPGATEDATWVLRCLSSWVRNVDIPPGWIATTPLLDWTFALLANVQLTSEEVFEAAVDVVVDILRAYPMREDEFDDPSVGTLVKKIVPLAMGLGIKTSAGPSTLDSPFDLALNEHDEDGLRAYCRIFTELGESYMSLIVGHEDLNQATLVDLVLRCSALSDKDIATITLHFWYRFVSCLETLEPYEYRQTQIDYFAAQLIRLLPICADLMRYPQDIQSLTSDVAEEVDRCRFHVADTLEDCCRLLGGDVVLHTLGDCLRTECHRVNSLPLDQHVLNWHIIEAHLFAIAIIFMYVADDEEKVLPFAMEVVPLLPPSPMLRSTSNLLIGRYSHWLDTHPEKLRPIMPFLAQGLSMAPSAPSAALAIRELCENCNRHMSLGEPVLLLYEEIIATKQQPPSPTTFTLELKDELEVLEGACKGMSKQLADLAESKQQNIAGNVGEEALTIAANSYVNRLVTPIGTRLTAIVSSQDDSRVGPRQASAELDRLTVVIRHFDLPSSFVFASQEATTISPMMSSKAKFILKVMDQCWGLLDSLSQRYPRDIHLAEKLCRLHKHSIRGCGAVAYRQMFESLKIQLVRNFAQSRQSPYLYAASICITEYANDVTCVPLLFHMLSELSQSVYDLLRTMDEFINYPDVVEEYFFLAGRMMSHRPEPLVLSPLLAAMIQCAAVAMKLDHHDANSGTLHFLESVFDYGLHLILKSRQSGWGHQNSGKVGSEEDAENRACAEALEKTVTAECRPVVENLAGALLGELPVYRLSTEKGSIISLLFKIHKLCPALLVQWIEPVLASTPKHARTMLLSCFTDGNMYREAFNSSVVQFSIMCRRGGE